VSKRNDKDIQVNPTHANWQLAKALATAEFSEDSETQNRALLRAEKWRQVLENIVSGSVDFGSRKPLTDVPIWATPEVITGGFVTGGLLAGGPLLEHEHQIALSAGIEDFDATSRTSLNAWYLTDEGLSSLTKSLKSGQYEVQVPEEAALLVVAFMANNENRDDARVLLDKIVNYFDKFRFYPIPSESVTTIGSDVYRWSVGKVADSLSQRKPNSQIDAQREAINIWAPLLDKIILLILETAHDGKPYQVIDSNWRERSKNLLNEIAASEKAHTLCKKPRKSASNFAQLRSSMQRQLDSGLSDNDIKRVGELVKRCINKRGQPGSSKHKFIRSDQSQQVESASYFDLNAIVKKRLAHLSQDDGVDNAQSYLVPVTEEESCEGVPAQAAIPEAVAKKVLRCGRDSIDELIATGVLPSADSLAEVLPQMTADIRSMGIRNPELRRLYSSVYRAFRRRRSLLLLNLEKQIHIEELPWVAAMERYRDSNLGSQESSHQALCDISLLTLSSFPHAIVPNKMIQELQALSKAAKLDLPFVNELAADIFMGTFTPKFSKAAKVAAKLLQNSLYANYYNIDYHEVLHLPEHNEKSGLLQSKHPLDFATLVSRRAGVHSGDWNIVANGMQIEQQQILTTQNLAVLTVGTKIQSPLKATAYDLSQACYEWICRRLQANTMTYHDHLIALKNSSYAWRQMIFFLSLQNEKNQHDFVSWANNHLDSQTAVFREQFKPAVVGLRTAIMEHSSPPREPGKSGALFYGWTKDRHWLMPERLSN